MLKELRRGLELFAEKVENMAKEGRHLPPGGFFYFNPEVLANAVGTESIYEASQLLKMHPEQVELKVKCDLSEEFEMYVDINDAWLASRGIAPALRPEVRALRQKEIEAVGRIVGERFEERMRRHLAALGWPNNEGDRDGRSDEAGTANDLSREGEEIEGDHS